MLGTEDDDGAGGFIGISLSLINAPARFKGSIRSGR